MIDVDRVSEVLLADGWHAVQKKSFGVGAWFFGENVDHEYDEFPYDDVYKQSVDKNCASWLETVDGREVQVTCPLSAVLAVREPGGAGPS